MTMTMRTREKQVVVEPVFEQIFFVLGAAVVTSLALVHALTVVAVVKKMYDMGRVSLTINFSVKKTKSITHGNN